jgi:hypothetical protein
MKTHPGIKALRRILKRMRWDDQGGYPSYAGNGEWHFSSTSLPQTTPTELNQLFALAGIEPDVIKSKGACSDCAHAMAYRDESGLVTYQEQGYKGPCSPCLRLLAFLSSGLL